jgi:hypothetical protein
MTKEARRDWWWMALMSFGVAWAVWVVWLYQQGYFQ